MQALICREVLNPKVIFYVIDYLKAWIKYRTEEIFKQRAAEARRSHRAVDKVTTKDDETDRVRLFLSKISFSVIADASYECGSYARSLLYSELHLRNLQDTKAATDLQPFFSKMQTIYSHLDEPDGIVGISEHINNPSLEQQILEHENLGKWDLALGCHELTLQKDPGSHASIGMLNCMKNLGQLGNVINHTHGILSSSLEMKEGCVTIGLEVSWRLRDWYSFGKINKFPNNSQTFDALVGQVLFAMQQNQNVAIEATMKNLLKSSTSSLMASTLETYERGYDSYINLHIIEELQAIQRIKPLLDSELGFPRLREMFMIWDRRLSLTRPSIKSRELILNVRQSAIDILWYVICLLAHDCSTLTFE